MDFIPIARPVIGDEEVDAVEKVLRSGMLVQGEAVREFEDRFSEYLGVEQSVAVSSGTVALDLSLKALDLENGSEVAVPAFSFIATANAILYQRLRPLFVDVDDRTFNIDPDDLQERLTSKTKAVIGVHLYGHPFDLGAVQEICEDHDLALIEDCAQAHGAEYGGRRVGSLGTGCFSFYPTKNMTSGEGGMITTDDGVLAARLRLMRNHGDTGKYNHVIVGYNYRMTNIQGAIGLAQLGKLEKFNSLRIKNAEYLTSKLRARGLTSPHRADGVKHVYNQYVVKVEDSFPLVRDELMTYLQERGIGTAVHYPMPIYRQPVYKEMGFEGISCPVAEEVSSRVMSLPVHPALSSEELEYVAKTINEIHG